MLYSLRRAVIVCRNTYNYCKFSNSVGVDFAKTADAILLRVSPNDIPGIIRTIRTIASNPLNSTAVLSKKSSEVKWFTSWLRSVCSEPVSMKGFSAIPNDEKLQKKAFELLQASLIRSSKYETSSLFVNNGTLNQTPLSAANETISKFLSKVPPEICITVSKYIDEYNAELCRSEKFRKNLKECCDLHTAIIEPILCHLGIKIDSFTKVKINKGIELYKAHQTSLTEELCGLHSKLVDINANLNLSHSKIPAENIVKVKSKRHNFGSKHCLKIEMKCIDTTISSMELPSVYEPKQIELGNTIRPNTHYVETYYNSCSVNNKKDITWDTGLYRTLQSTNGFEFRRANFVVPNNVLMSRYHRPKELIENNASQNTRRYTLFLQNLPVNISIMELKNALKGFGTIGDVELLGKYLGHDYSINDISSYLSGDVVLEMDELASSKSTSCNDSLGHHKMDISEDADVEELEILFGTDVVGTDSLSSMLRHNTTEDVIELYDDDQQIGYRGVNHELHDYLMTRELSPSTESTADRQNSVLRLTSSKSRHPFVSLTALGTQNNISTSDGQSNRKFVSSHDKEVAKVSIRWESLDVVLSLV